MAYKQTATFTDSALFEKKWREKMTLPFHRKYWDDTVDVLSFDDKNDPVHRHFQRDLHVDIIVVTKDKWHMIDDKVVNPPDRREYYTGFSLETRSNIAPGRERDGWMKTSQCSIVMWWFLHRSSGICNAYLLPFKPLQKWFYEGSRYKRFDRCEKDNYEGNKTEVYVAPIGHVTAAIPGVQRFEVTEDGELLDVERFS